MKHSVVIRVVTGAVAVCGVVLWVTTGNDGGSMAKVMKKSGSVQLLPGETRKDDWAREEVFRRAFWRHPAAGDEILDAVRIESAGADGVRRWAWFIRMHPGPELLSALRDPATFGLTEVETPQPALPDDITAPEWFQLTNEDGVVTLQNPSQALTIRYHAKDNLLLASDHGRGFAKGVSEN